MTAATHGSVSFVLIGDLMIDIAAVTNEPINYASDTPARISIQPGGGAATTAAWLAHLGEDVHLIGALGDDFLARMFREALTAQGVHLHAAEIAGASTGTCIVLVDATGERTMLPDPGANLAIEVAQLTDSLFTSGAHLHLSGYTLLNPTTRGVGQAALARARARQLTSSLDLASAAPIAVNRDPIWAALDEVDVLLANRDEAAALTGLADTDAALAALTQAVDTVVIKCGPGGAVAAQGHLRCAVPALPAKVIDTTGAGDAFAAGFLAGWCAGRELPEAVAAGVQEATRTLSRVGGGPMAP
ncbi:MAG: PfkB family carbohydrate kinase [Actinomycetota bacterium]|nr:PfkB family carbohydrate kinase [Actinomycetota bacterium]